METHCVPRSNRDPYNSLSWWFFQKFSIFRRRQSMYSLKWLHLWSLPIRQTYQRKCFRSILLWKCGSFRDSRITDTPRSCIVYAVRPYSWGWYFIRARVWSISVVYRVGFFHNLHRVNERGSTLLFYRLPPRSLTDKTLYYYGSVRSLLQEEQHRLLHLCHNGFSFWKYGNGYPSQTGYNQVFWQCLHQENREPIIHQPPFSAE